MVTKNQDNPAAVFFVQPHGESQYSQQSVLLLRWLVIIATSYLVLFTGKVEKHALIGALLVSFIL